MMSNVFAMGDYGLFIWLAYAIGVGVLLITAVISVRSLRNKEAELQILQDTLSNQRVKESILRSSEKDVHVLP